MAKRGSGRPQGGVRPRNQGFTLIELLFVTVVVGVLASIFAPAFGKARERAYLSRMQAARTNPVDQKGRPSLT